MTSVITARAPRKAAGDGSSKAKDIRAVGYICCHISALKDWIYNQHHYLQLLAALPRKSPWTIVGQSWAQHGPRAVGRIISADDDGGDRLNDNGYRI